MAGIKRDSKRLGTKSRGFKKSDDNILFEKDKKGFKKQGSAKSEYKTGSKSASQRADRAKPSKYTRDADMEKTKRQAHAKDRLSSDMQNEASLDYIYGINAVREAFEGERTINSVMIETGKHSPNVHEIIVKAKERHVVIKEVAKEKLRSLVNTDRHQGVVAYMSPIQYYDVDKIKKDEENSDVIIALDEITDVNNLGAILRTVEACGFRYVMIPERRSCQLNSSVSKTSVGAIEYVRTVRVSSLSKALSELKDAGYWVVGTDGSAKTDYKEVDYSGKIVIVIGSEGKGMRSSIKALCDFIVSIPMYGRINSLNASVSASILLYEAVRNKK